MFHYGLYYILFLYSNCSIQCSRLGVDSIGVHLYTRGHPPLKGGGGAGFGRKSLIALDLRPTSRQNVCQKFWHEICYSKRCAKVLRETLRDCKEKSEKNLFDREQTGRYNRIEEREREREKKRKKKMTHTIKVHDYYGEELDVRCGACADALEQWAREYWEGACHCTTFEITNEEN